MTNQKTIISEFSYGEHFGEISLLTKNPLRTATAKAKTDGMLLTLPKDDFFLLIEKIPELGMKLSQSLGRRMIHMEKGYSKHRHQVNIASMSYDLLTQELRAVFLDFVKTLTEYGKPRVLVIDLSQSGEPCIINPHFNSEMNLNLFDPLPNDQKITEKTLSFDCGAGFIKVQYKEDNEEEEKNFSTLLTKLTFRYDYISIVLPKKMGRIADKAMKYSDRVYFWSTDHEGSLATSKKSLISFKNQYGFSLKDLKWVIYNQQEESKKISFAYGQSEGISIFSFLPEKNDTVNYERIIHFIAKEWAGHLIGLALGSGAAYGVAHIGVLKVLEEEGIHVDVVSGSSIGALVGSVWAAGYKSEDIADILGKLDTKGKSFKQLVGFADLSLPHNGFIKGKRVMKFLRGFLGDKSFRDLNKVFRSVAVNLFSGEEVVFDSGNVVEAVRASISIPGVFRPVKYKNTRLIDGGILDPLPVKVLQQMGVDKIIAVNVLPSPNDRLIKQQKEYDQYEKMRKSKNIFKRFSASISRSFHNRYGANVFNVLMNTIQFMEYEMAKNWESQSDVYIHAVVPEAHWIEFFKPEPFLKKGEDATRKKLKELKKLKEDF